LLPGAYVTWVPPVGLANPAGLICCQPLQVPVPVEEAVDLANGLLPVVCRAAAGVGLADATDPPVTTTAVTHNAKTPTLRLQNPSRERPRPMRDLLVRSAPLADQAGGGEPAARHGPPWTSDCPAFIRSLPSRQIWLKRLCLRRHRLVPPCRRAY
jgi:hypothetical protein